MLRCKTATLHIKREISTPMLAGTGYSVSSCSETRPIDCAEAWLTELSTLQQYTLSYFYGIGCAGEEALHRSLKDDTSVVSLLMYGKLPLTATWRKGVCEAARQSSGEQVAVCQGGSGASSARVHGQPCGLRSVWIHDCACMQTWAWPSVCQHAAYTRFQLQCPKHQCLG